MFAKMNYTEILHGGRIHDSSLAWDYDAVLDHFPNIPDMLFVHSFIGFAISELVE